MRVLLTLEDTPTGVDLHIEAGASGCQDHPIDSLSMMILLQFELQVKTLARQNALSLKEDGRTYANG